MTPISDDVKIQLAHDILQRLTSQPIYIWEGHLGCLFGQWVEAGYPVESAQQLTLAQCEHWIEDGSDIPERAQLRHIGNDEIIELMTRGGSGEVPADGRPPVDDIAGILDLGCQFGQRVETASPHEWAFYHAGEWLNRYYPSEAGNPWPQPTTPEFPEGPGIPTTPGDHPDPIVGQLHYGDHAFADANGPRNVCGIHLGDLIGQGLHFGLGHIRPLLELSRNAGYHFIRSWTNVQPGSAWWANKPAPAWSPHDNPILFREILALGMEHGLTWHLAPGGLDKLTDEQENALFDEIASAIGDVGPNGIALMEACNEVYGTGDENDKNPQELERLIQRIRSKHKGVLYSLSAAAGADESRDIIRTFTSAWMEHYYYHPQRGGHLNDKLRHCFSMGYGGEAQAVRWSGWAGEPWGNGRLVSVTENKHELDAGAMALGACMAMMARQAWAHMGGSSVIVYDDPITTPGFAETAAAVRELPKDLGAFPTLGHGGESWAKTRIYKARGSVRADYAIAADDDYVCIKYGPPHENPGDLEQARDIAEKRVILNHPWGQVEVGKLGVRATPHTADEDEEVVAEEEPATKRKPAAKKKR